MGVNVSAKLPGFIVIGSQKSGTSSLFFGLNQHPQIYMAPAKELNYFYHEALFAKGPGHYATYFKEAPEGTICGEASPGYICHPRTPARIRRQLPDVKLILTIRDPVERAYSQYWDNRRQLAEGRSFDGLLEGPQHQVFNPDQKNYFSRGLYSVYLERYLALFPRDQLLIIQFDELKKDPESVYKRCFEFIGVDPDAGTGDANQIANFRSVFSNPLYHFAFNRPALAVRLPSFIKWMLRWGPQVAHTPDPVSPHTEQRLRDYFAPYDRALEGLLGEAPYWMTEPKAIQTDSAVLEDTENHP